MLGLLLLSTDTLLILIKRFLLRNSGTLFIMRLDYFGLATIEVIRMLSIAVYVCSLVLQLAIWTYH